MINNQDFYNRITISDFILQLITLYAVSLDASNNDLMEELQRHEKKYLDKIIENQNKILAILENKSNSPT